MITFKQFLQEMDPLDEVGQLMAIRLILGIKNKRDAQQVLDWIHQPKATYDDLDDHLSQLIADEMSEAAGVEGLADHLAWSAVKDHLKLEVERQARHGLDESVDPLVATQVEMFFRQELSLPKEEAKSATGWAMGEDDWGDLVDDTWQHILDYVGDVSDRDIYSMNSARIEEFALETVTSRMYHKYGIEL